MCKHRHASLVYESIADFVAYQCDTCGMVLRREVPTSALADTSTLPLLDNRRYYKATDAAIERLFAPQTDKAVQLLAILKRK